MHLINQRFCLDQRTSMVRKRIYVISECIIIFSEVIFEYMLETYEHEQKARAVEVLHTRMAQKDY